MIATLSAHVADVVGDACSAERCWSPAAARASAAASRVRLAQEGADVVINYNSDPKGAEEALAEVEATRPRGRDDPGPTLGSA